MNQESKYEFLNDLNVYCSAREHKEMVLDLIRVYGSSMSLQDVLDSINYQMEKYVNLMIVGRSEINTLDLGDLEDNALKEAMIKADGNMGKAAELLGVSRSTLWRKIKMKERGGQEKDGGK